MLLEVTIQSYRSLGFNEYLAKGLYNSLKIVNFCAWSHLEQ